MSKTIVGVKKNQFKKVPIFYYLKITGRKYILEVSKLFFNSLIENETINRRL